MDIYLNKAGPLGDLLFLQKAARVCANAGHIVHWKLAHTMFWLKDYIQDPNIIFYAEHEQIPEVDAVFDANFYPEDGINNHPYDVMSIKYDNFHNMAQQYQLNLDTTLNNWQDFLIFNRNMDKEQSLYNQLVGNKSYYILINKHFSAGYLDFVSTKNDYVNIVEMHTINGFSLIDWSLIIERAEAIYTVDTSLNYLVESLDTEATGFYVYPRHEWHTKLCLAPIFNRKPWVWLDYGKKYSI